MGFEPAPARSAERRSHRRDVAAGGLARRALGSDRKADVARLPLSGRGAARADRTKANKCGKSNPPPAAKEVVDRMVNEIVSL